jgi:hypothetical protein
VLGLALVGFEVVVVVDVVVVPVVEVDVVSVLPGTAVVACGA